LGLRVVNASTLQPLYPDLRKIFSDTLLNTNAEDFFQTEDGTMWIASGLGICSHTIKNGMHVFRKPEAIVQNVFGAVSSICAADSGIWFGVYNNEIYSGIGNVDWQTNKVSWYHYFPDDPDNLTWGYVTAIAKDRHGVIWIGTSRGLNKLNPARQVFKLYKQFPNRRYTSWDNVYAIYKDDEGIIWLGTDGKLLIRYDRLKNNYRKMFEVPDASEGMYSIVPFGKENILLGTQARGLLLFNKRTRKSLTLVEPPPPSGGQVSEMSGVVYDSVDQKIWVGWCGTGLMSYDLKTRAKKFYTHDENDSQSISSNQVTALWRSHDGTLWVGKGDIVNTIRSEQGRGLY
jgi:ligand-binding sensor domain-containing protein